MHDAHEKLWTHLSAAEADKKGSVTQKEIDAARTSGKLKPSMHHGRGHEGRGSPYGGPDEP